MGSNRPKVLHDLLGAPLLEHVLDAVEEVRPDARVVVVGHGREEVREAFSSREILWAVQEEQLGTAHAAHIGVEGAASLLDRHPDAEVLILNGDLPLLSGATLARLLERHRGSPATRAATVLTCAKSDPTGYGRIVRDGDGHLVDIVEEKDATPATRAIRDVNVGVYVFGALAFREFYRDIGRRNAQGELYLTDVVVRAARGGRAGRAGSTVETLPVEDESEVAQVNTRAELASAGEILRARLLREHMEQGVTVDDPRTTFIEKGVKIGVDTRILPCTMIRRGVQIGEGCEIGPFAHLRAGTRLGDRVSVGNFVEMKNTRVGERTKVRHLSYLGDGIVGRNVNIGAGTVFANYDGKVKSTTEVKDGAFVGSGTVLVAPVTVGAGAVTGAGSVVLKNRDVADGEVVVGVPARSLGKTAERR